MPSRASSWASGKASWSTVIPIGASISTPVTPGSVRQFGVANLKGFGLNQKSPEILAAGVLLEYLGETSKRSLGHVSSLSIYAERSFVDLDEATQRNLELLANLQDGSRKYSLLEVLDQTRTSPGARKLRRWILTPLKERAAIERRLASVEALYREQVLLARLREALGAVLDLERLTARVAMDRAHAKDLLAIGSTLVAVLSLGALLARERSAADPDDILRLAEPLGLREQQMRDLAGLLARAINESRPSCSPRETSSAAATTPTWTGCTL